MDKERITSLIVSAQNGSEEAFNELYNMTNVAIYNSIYSILNDPDLTADIVQETYLKVLKSRIKTLDNGMAYLITIARNLAINDFNRRKREVLIDFTEEELRYREVDPKENVNNINILDVIKKYLKPNQVKLISLHIFDGLTHREIAKKYNKPIGTIMWQYNEAIKELRKRFNEENKN